jgi:hypothetical protein
VKYTDTPKIAGSQRQAIEQLGLDSLTIVVPGEADYSLEDRIHVLGLNRTVASAPAT